MESKTPKQFLLLNNQPVLMHTIRRFHEYNPLLTVTVVLPETEIQRWKQLITEFQFPIKHSIVTGGKTRFLSVKNGLQTIQEKGTVAVHDGVRPLCSSALIKRCFEEAEILTNAIPAIPVTDSIRQVSGANNISIDRDTLRIIQTPQCFDVHLLKKAYSEYAGIDITDDAGVFENAGNKIHLTDGEKTNIKITEAGDMIVAAALEKKLFSI